jgi:hypothetical protein
MSYPEGAWERAMTVQDALLKAIAGELHSRDPMVAETSPVVAVSRRPVELWMNTA